MMKMTMMRKFVEICKQIIPHMKQVRRRRIFICAKSLMKCQYSRVAYMKT